MNTSEKMLLQNLREILDYESTLLKTWGKYRDYPKGKHEQSANQEREVMKDVYGHLVLIERHMTHTIKRYATDTSTKFGASIEGEMERGISKKFVEVRDSLRRMIALRNEADNSYKKGLVTEAGLKTFYDNTYMWFIEYVAWVESIVRACEEGRQGS